MRLWNRLKEWIADWRKSAEIRRKKKRLQKKRKSKTEDIYPLW